MEYIGGFMNKKNKILLVLLCVLIPTVGLGFNWFSHQDEKQVQGEALTVNGELNIVEFEGGDKLVPGDKICENINLKIDSTAPSFIRVKINPYYSESANGNKIYDSIANINLAENSNWIKSNDGYYYYNEAVNIDNNKSKELNFINSIVFNPEDANSYQGKFIGVEIKMEMVQAKYGVYEQAWNIDNTHEMADTFKTISDYLSE